MIKTKNLLMLTLGCLALLLTSCSGERGHEPATRQQSSDEEGKIPVEISSITTQQEVLPFSGQKGGLPTPRVLSNTPELRITETSEGGFQFQSGDQIHVQVEGSDKVGLYQYDGTKWNAVTPVYWQKEKGQTEKVKAWYTNCLYDSKLNIRYQSDKLAYAFAGKNESATSGEPVSITLKSQLAKLIFEGTGGA